ncbi:hypothetical protein GTS_13160 [Gandjariella thermophila]|uniref:Uncharacterized protein n=1 Tax=Gandjariella thermophila TaxID=1931992 RepID=A0A4D4J6Y1_9PSEU|nr:hypothetical protein GTS_13160 [Gandjariella thermophila]
MVTNTPLPTPARADGTSERTIPISGLITMPCPTPATAMPGSRWTTSTPVDAQSRQRPHALHRMVTGAPVGAPG